MSLFLNTHTQKKKVLLIQIDYYYCYYYYYSVFGYRGSVIDHLFDACVFPTLPLLILSFLMIHNNGYYRISIFLVCLFFSV